MNSSPVEVILSPAQKSAWQSARCAKHPLLSFLVRTLPTGRRLLTQFIGRTFMKAGREFMLTRSGARIAIDPFWLDTYIRIMSRDGVWQPHILATLERILRPADVFYDIGANVGFFSCELCNVCKGLSVVAFEPLWSLATQVALSGYLNDFSSFRVFSTLLGNEEGTRNLFVARSSVHSSLVPRVATNRQTQECRMCKLDNLVTSEHLAPPSVIKIDVEGAELEVFRGARQLIAHSSPAILFEADQNMLRFGIQFNDLRKELMRDVDYHFFWLIGESLEQLDDESDVAFGNFLALAPEGLDRIEGRSANR